MPTSQYQVLQERYNALVAERNAIVTLAEASAVPREFTTEEMERITAMGVDLARVGSQLTLMSEIREQMRAAPAPPDHQVTVHDRAADKPFASLGDQLQAIAQAGQGNYQERERLIQAASGSNEAIDSEGGFLVMQDFLAGIENRMYSGGEILSRVRQIEVGPSSNGIVMRTIDESSRATGSRWGGIRGYWIDEADTITDSKPKFGRFELKLKKVAALGYATDEVLADAAALNSIFTTGFADELMFLVEDAILNGDGASKPLGIVGHAATVSVAKETGQAAGTVVFANVRKMRARQWARSRKNSAWFINQEDEEQLQTMTLVIGTGGVPVYLPASGISEDGFDRLYGRPVIPVEYCKALGTVGDIILADLSQYAMIRKGGVQQASSMHVKFTTDEMAFRAVYRCDGAPMWSAALTPFQATSGATLSPIVTLATRA